ncbi:MAG: HAD hydrolase family protein [Gammaproteobacteria bacterium]|nr:HAD hydrolase family protein [Gammaproteobacteria bacterium]
MTQIQNLNPDLQSRVSAIRALTLDVDGVLTDGRITYDSNGMVIQSFHVHDGYGVKAVQAAGIGVAIISGRNSLAVELRARELDIVDVYQGIEDKLAVLNEYCARQGLSLDQVAHIGDDVPDIPVFKAVGLAVAVADAVKTAKAAADLVTDRRGGRGAVREFCDLLLEGRKL